MGNEESLSAIVITKLRVPQTKRREEVAYPEGAIGDQNIWGSDIQVCLLMDI